MTIEWHYRWLKRWQKIRNIINMYNPDGQAKVMRCNLHIELLNSRLKMFAEITHKQRQELTSGLLNYGILIPYWKRFLMRLKSL